MDDHEIPLPKRCIIATQMRAKGFSGNQIHAEQAMLFAKKRGWQVELLTPFSGRSALRTFVFGLRFGLKHLSASLDIFWLREGHNYYLKRALRKALTPDQPPTVIYAQDPLSADAALGCCRKGKDAVVLIVHYNESQAEEWRVRSGIPHDGWLFRQITALERRVLPAVDSTIFVSDWMRSLVQARIPQLSAARSVIIPNFVETPEVLPNQERRDLIAIGALEPRKNQQYLLRVLAELKRRGISLTLTLAGDGQDRRMLEELSLSLGIAEQVKFLGNIPNAARHLAAHRIQVHAALLENCPISLIEGLASAKPIVAAAKGGIPEILSQEVGRFWDLESESDGATVLQELLSSPDLESIGKLARERYLQNYAPEVCGTRLLHLFTQCLVEAHGRR